VGKSRVARAVGSKAGRDNPGSAKVLVEDHKALVKAEVAIGQIKVAPSALRKTRFDEMAEVIAKEAEGAAQREWKVEVVNQFEACQEPLENEPGIAKMLRDLRAGTHLALGSE
jgi:hypothetical protein